MSQRVLVFSLLRLGDTLVHAPVLAALKARGFDVHVAIQPVSQAAVSLLSQQFTVHVLPETFTGHDGSGKISRWAQEMKAKGFYASFNPTHKAFSAQLAEAVTPGAVLGLGMPNGRPTLSSPWMRYLNEWGSFAPLSVFHYGDAFCQSVESTWENPKFHPSRRAIDAWETRKRALNVQHGDPLVFIQLFTSERKKNYPLSLWKRAIESVRQRISNAKFVVLAAPSEKAAADAFCADLAPNVSTWVCDFEEAYAGLQSASLLISGDTSMVHLASLADTRVLLLSLGSSAFRELGPYGDKHVILQTHFPCSPCPHDESCVARTTSDSPFPCTETGMLPEDVANIAIHMLTKSAVKEVTTRASVYQSHRDDWNLMSYSNAHEKTATDACADVLREFLMSQLPVAVKNGKANSAVQSSGLTDNSRNSLKQMAKTLEAIVHRAKGNDQGQWDAAIAGAEDVFNLSLFMQASARFRESTAQSLPQYEALLSHLQSRLS